jgi:2-aminobenzoate-CoA ligase
MADRVAVSAHVDTFCADHLPPAELMPVRRWDAIPELAYPERLNCAADLLDQMVDAGHADRPAIRFPGGEWSYRELLANANRIAHVLVHDLGIVPGNRVLLRGANTPMLAACWFGVLKAGGVVVCTMALLRERELQYIAQKAEISLALTDARVAEDCESAISATRAHVVRFGGDGPDDLTAMMREKPATFATCDTAAEDIAIIAFTSGTTGQGKGTMHSHRDILAITDCFPR